MKISQLNEAKKSLVSIPAWQQRLLSDSGNFTNSIDSVAAAYSNVPLVYRGVKMRCDALSSVPVRIYKGETEALWPYKTSLRDLIWHIEADLLGAGNAVVLKLRNQARVLDLQRLNPFTITVTYDQSRGLIFSQHGQAWNEDEIIYIKEFSYNDDLTSGVGTVQACLNDAALMNYQTRFASRFFEAGAMPIVVWGADGVINEDERKRIQTFFQRTTSGVSNAFRNLVLKTKLIPNVVSQDLDKMSMPELYDQATKNIANAFGIPVNMFMGDDNYASADSHRMGFWQDVIRPRARLFEEAFNKQLLEKLGLRLEFAFDEMDIFQADESQRADSLSKLVMAGIPLGDAMEMLGYDLPQGKTYADYNVKPEVVEIPTAQPEPLEDELGKWQKKSLKRLEKGKSADCPFESDIIPEGMQAEIHEALKLCVDEEEVNRVFEGTYEHSGLADLLGELKSATLALRAEPMPVIVRMEQNDTSA